MKKKGKIKGLFGFPFFFHFSFFSCFLEQKTVNKQALILFFFVNMKKFKKTGKKNYEFLVLYICI